jgi:hypothetical protein
MDNAAYVVVDRSKQKRMDSPLADDGHKLGAAQGMKLRGR